MANYNDAQALLQQLKPIINRCIENHPLVKSAIKAKKATVESVDTAKKTVTVRFPFDTSLTTLPYNPQMENYLTTGTVKGKTVSVWFYQSISNGIVMQDGAWSVSESGDSSNIFDLVYPVGSIYMSVNNVNPQTLFSGTWEKIEGRFLLGASNSYSLGSSGGDANAVNVKHSHTGIFWKGDGQEIKRAGTGAGTLGVEMSDNAAGNYNYSIATSMEGEDGTGKNMPPYLAVNIWKRTA